MYHSFLSVTLYVPSSVLALPKEFSPRIVNNMQQIAPAGKPLLTEQLLRIGMVGGNQGSCSLFVKADWMVVAQHAYNIQKQVHTSIASFYVCTYINAFDQIWDFLCATRSRSIQGTILLCIHNQGAKGGKAKARAQNASRMQQQLSLFSSPPWEQNACQQCYTYLLQPCLSKLCLGQPLHSILALGEGPKSKLGISYYYPRKNKK